MAKKNGDIFADIKADIERRVDQAQLNIAEEIGFEIERRYEYAIDRFYKDPAFKYNPTDVTEPLYYKRDYNLYAASSGYDNIGESFLGSEIATSMGHISNRVRKYKDGYIAGITVHGNIIPGNPYKVSKDYVFTRAYQKGIHGLYSLNQRKINAGINRYNRDVMFGGWKNIPSTMKPTPEYIMNKEFKKIKSNDFLSSISEKHFLKVFN